MFKRGFEFAPGYRLESFLGKGQFGQVWKSTAPGGTYQAVKFIDLAGGQWEKEYEGIQRVKRIGHPNLMPILAIWLLGNDGKALAESVEGNQAQTIQPDVTQDLIETAQIVAESQEPDWMSKHSGRLEARWMVVSMQLGGKNLLQRLAECHEQGHTGIPPKELLRLIEESARGLDYLNFSPDLNTGGGSLQHCDVKPANIVLIGGSAVVCDFGLARIMAQDQATMSSVAGTPAYLPPEAINGKTSRNSDQYSLAVTYYQLRTGKLPLTGKSTGEIIIEHLHGKLTFEDVPEAERAILRRATHFKWEERFESNSAMVEALRDTFRVPVETVLQPPPPSNQSPWKKWVGIASAVLILFLIWTLFQPSEKPVPPPPSPIPPVEVSVELLDITKWDQLLNESLGDSAASVQLFKDLLASYPEVGIPKPIDLQGHEKELQQVSWISALGAKRPNEASMLITRSLQPSLVSYELASIESILLSGYQTRFSSDSVDAIVDLSKPPTVTIFDHRPYPSALAISPDATWGASGGFDGQVQIWPTTRRESQPRIKFSIGDADVTAIIWHPTKNYLIVAGSDAIVHVVESVPDWPEGITPSIKSFPITREIVRGDFDRFGEVLLATDAEGQLLTIAWKDLESFLLSGDKPMVSPLSTPGTDVRDFRLVDSDATGSIAVSSGGAGEISYYSLSTRELIERKSVVINSPVITFDAAMLSDGICVVSGGESGQLTVKRGGSGNVAILPGHRDTVTAAAISPDGLWLASVSWDGWATVRPLFGNPSGSFFAFRPDSQDALSLVSWDPSGRLLVTGGDNGQLMLWDARHLRLLALALPQTDTPEPLPDAPSPTPSEPDLERPFNL